MDQENREAKYADFLETEFGLHDVLDEFDILETNFECFKKFELTNLTVKFVECAGDIASIEKLLSKYDFLWKSFSFNVEFKFANSIE